MAMRADLFPEMYRLEETYWWHVAKRRLVLTLLTPFLRNHAPGAFLDVGCGTGMMLKDLSALGRVVGIDGTMDALRYSRQRGASCVILADCSRPFPIRSSAIHVVTMLDVLEHLDDDDLPISEIHRVLRPSGMFVLTVPAYPFLWTYWDEILGHKRRYRRSALVKKLERNGFSVLRHSYFYSYLLPVAILFRVTKSLLGVNVKMRSDFIALPRWLNRFLLSMSYLEQYATRFVRIPAGLSVICVCKKI